MTSPERHYGVELDGVRVGGLRVRDDYTRFAFDAAYIADPGRPVLGLRFEDDLEQEHRANQRLPWWFSNLLPEGRLRELIARARGVPVAREMELLAQIGHDLPGAVTITGGAGSAERPLHRDANEASSDGHGADETRWRFSLAGVQLKFSMRSAGDRLTVPMHDQLGQWIVKLPDPSFTHVPANENAMMELARRCGIEVPETRLVHRDLIEGIDPRLWPEGETYAYAVKRFDRQGSDKRIHMEDFAQVRGVYPGEDQYRGSFETLANLVWRRRDDAALREFARRLAFNVVVRNGDAHLKNWSLLYRDTRVPTLSPVYDLVCTAAYGMGDDLGLKLNGSRRFEDVRLGSFDRLQQRLGATDLSLAEEAARAVEAVARAWPEVRETLPASPILASIDEAIALGLKGLGVTG